MASLNKVRLADGQEFSLSEVYHQPRYSTVDVAAADAVNVFAFNYTPGQPVSRTPAIAARTATELDTNQTKRKGMNQDESLIVMAITFEVFALTSVDTGVPNNFPIAVAPVITATDLRRIQIHTMFELFVGAGIKKPQYQSRFAWINQSIGAEAAVSGDTGTTTVNLEYGTAGEISAKNQELLELPIYIGGFGIHARPGNSMFFQVRFFNTLGVIPGLRQDFQIRFYLDGLTKRPA